MWCAAAGERRPLVTCGAVTSDDLHDDASPEPVDLSMLDVHVPDGVPDAEALARTTDVGIVAHPDDLELVLLPAVAACVADPQRWFCGIVCTDGAGSVRAGTAADLDDAALVAVRRAEQLAAADLGGYGAVIQLAWSSASARTDVTGLVDALEPILRLCRAVNLWTHDLADAHATHVAVGLAAVLAARRLPMPDRPVRAVGVEGWRSLDWLPAQHRVVLDTSDAVALGRDLAAVFPSQLGAGKRYDLAAEGRRVANATFAEPRAVDAVDQAALAMDLTPVVRNESIDPHQFVAGALVQFADETTARLRDVSPAT